MKTTLALLAVLVATIAIAAPFLLFVDQQTVKARIMYAEPVSGRITARDTKTGRTFEFTVAPDVAAALKPGDAVEADLGAMKLVNIKGVMRTAAIREPDAATPCCGIVAFATDGAALEALLRGLSGAEPVGASRLQPDGAEPVSTTLRNLLNSISNADPVNSAHSTLDFRSLLRGADPVNGLVDPAEPVNGILLARDLATGAHHLVVMSGTPPAGAIGSAMTSGGGVSIDDRAGVAVFRANNQTYSYPLYRPYSARAGGEKKWPWVITPNAQLRGIQGRLVTNFPEKTGGTQRMVYVYTPGTEEEVSSAVTGGPQEIVEGEYDVKVMKVTVPKVPIKRGHETRLLIGALTFAAATANSINYVFDETGAKELFFLIGQDTTAMPVGTYSIKSGSRVIKFQIKDGEVTEL